LTINAALRLRSGAATLRWTTPSPIGSDPTTTSDVTLELDDQDVRSKVGENEGRISWRSIARVIETKDGLFLALSRAELLAVPKRALPSADAFADLARHVRAKIEASRAVQ
jgi:hypothetical protein